MDEQALMDGYLADETLLAASGCESLEDVRKIELLVDASEVLLGALGHRMPHLRQLKMNGSHMTNIRDLGTSLSSLRVLWLNRASLGSLAGMSALPALQELYVAFNYIDDISPLAALPELRTVDLEGNRIAELSDLQFLVQCPHLTSANLDGNPISSDPGYRAAVAEAIPQLEYLDDEEVAELTDTPTTPCDPLHDLLLPGQHTASEGGAPEPSSSCSTQPRALAESWPQCARGGSVELAGIIESMQLEIEEKASTERQGLTEDTLRERERCLIQECIRRTGQAVASTDPKSRPASRASRPWTGSGNRPSSRMFSATQGMMHMMQAHPLSLNPSHSRPGTSCLGSLQEGLLSPRGVPDLSFLRSDSSTLTHGTAEVLCGNPIRGLRAKQYPSGGGEGGAEEGGHVVSLTHASSALAHNLEAHTDETVLENVIASKLSQMGSDLSYGGSGSSASFPSARSCPASRGAEDFADAEADPPGAAEGKGGMDDHPFSLFQSCDSLSLSDFTPVESVL